MEYSQIRHEYIEMILWFPQPNIPQHNLLRDFNMLQRKIVWNTLQQGEKSPHDISTQSKTMVILIPHQHWHGS